MLRNNKIIYILIVMISAVMLMAACGQQQAEPSGDSENVLDYRIAGRDEGVGMMMSNDAYYDGFTQNDLDFRMQKTGASMEEYKAFAKEQVLDFSTAAQPRWCRSTAQTNTIHRKMRTTSMRFLVRTQAM